MITIACWLWGHDKYSEIDVERLRLGVSRHLQRDHRFLCITDRVGKDYYHPMRQEDLHLLSQPRGYLVRLRMFDPAWQAEIGLEDKLVCMDLDSVVTGPLDPLFERNEDFVILQGANAANPCPYNGSLLMLRAGCNSYLWHEFNLAELSKVPRYEVVDDQAWYAYKKPNAAGWKAGKESGVYAFHKPGWPAGDNLPADARLVVFPGWRSPAKFARLPWVNKYWVSLTSPSLSPLQ